jgi:GAF domain-containing protein/HAMP domain-containing protein
MNSFKLYRARKQEPRQTGGWLANISVRWKLNLIIIVSLVGFTGIFYSAYAGLQALQYHILFQYESMLVPATTLDRADIALGDIQTQLEVLSKSTQSIADKLGMLDRIKDKEDVFSSVFQRYTDTWTTTLDPEFTTTLKEQGRLDLQQDETATVLQIKKDFDSYIKLRDRLQIMVDAGMNLGLINQHIELTIVANDALRNHLRHLTDLTRQFAIVSKKAAQTAYNRALFAMGLALAISVSLGLLLAFAMARSIVNRLGFVTHAAQSLQQGHLEERATTSVGGRDEIAQMAAAFDTMGEQLTQTFSNLEQRVSERTTELEYRSLELADRTVQLEISNIRAQKRAAQLRTISEVSKTISSIHSLQELLPRITNVVSEQFDFYHVSIFLTDDANQFAILSAANSAGGKKMLARGHRLEVGSQGIVGFVTATGTSRIALDTDSDTVFFNNPDLPDTHSEVAVPLRLDARIIGALDIQSNQINAFFQEDLDAFSILADQITIAIENSRLFESTKKSIAEAETLYRNFLHQEWKAQDKSEVVGFHYSTSGALPLETRVREETLQTVASSGRALSEIGEKAFLAIPVKLRDEVIGVLKVNLPGKRIWKSDEIGVVQAVADRIAISAENARLFDESQKRAAKEQVIGKISAKIGSSSNLDSVFHTLMEELGNILPGSEIVVQFDEGHDAQPPNTP